MAGRHNHKKGEGPKPQGIIKSHLPGKKKEKIPGVKASPVRFSEEKFAEILELIACGQGVKPICELEGMPNVTNFWKWTRRSQNGQARYLEAKKLGVFAMLEEAQEITDDGSNDWTERLAFNGGNPGWELNGEHVQRSKLRWDRIKWQIGKLMPDVFGDNHKLDVQVTDISDRLAAGRARVAAAKRGTAS